MCHPRGYRKEPDTKRIEGAVVNAIRGLVGKIGAGGSLRKIRTGTPEAPNSGSQRRRSIKVGKSMLHSRGRCRRRRHIANSSPGAAAVLMGTSASLLILRRKRGKNFAAGIIWTLALWGGIVYSPMRAPLGRVPGVMRERPQVPLTIGVRGASRHPHVELRGATLRGRTEWRRRKWMQRRREKRAALRPTRKGH